MIALFICYLLSIIFLLLEWWAMKHTYVYRRSTFGQYAGWEKYDMRVINLVGLVIVNIIPIVNVIYFIAFWPIMYDNSCCDYENELRLTPPEALKDEVKQSKLDKLLNKKL